MNNRNGMLASVLSIGAAGAAIFGLAKGMRNGTFQPFMKTILSTLVGSAAPQIAPAAQVAQGMMNGQSAQNMTKPLQGMMNNQGAQQQSANQTPNNIKQSINNLSNNKSN